MTEIKEAAPVEESLRVIAESLQGIRKSLHGIEQALYGIVFLLLLIALWCWLRHS